ncbi:MULTISPECIES: pyridoxal 5'-phosphate synthase glutaminase subunit PdxT [unclassified Microbacterium]|uniref:pyridoxal 5'-phosphate synthase glutaminase subunit PdxT n=1 Tax=unclassified Microbacterium TaxID=2609290 RepID=UPI003870D269
MLTGLGAEVVLVRRAAELDDVDGLVLPGGESSVIDKLSRAFGLQAPVRAKIARGMPVFGTCAGLILLADRVEGLIRGQQTFGGLDITARRNAFGSQIDSFDTELVAPDLGAAPVAASFIRAPVVASVGASVRVLATLPSGVAVAVEQGPLLATAFHPEMTGETRFHERFLASVATSRARQETRV